MLPSLPTPSRRLAQSSQSSVLQDFAAGLGMVGCAVALIVMSVLRAARFLVAGALCVVGMIGMGALAIAKRIIHPSDRRFLPVNR